MNKPHLRVVSSNSSKVRGTPRSRARRSNLECQSPGIPEPTQLRIVDCGMPRSSDIPLTPPKRSKISLASLDMKLKLSNIWTIVNPKNGQDTGYKEMHPQGYNTSMPRTLKKAPTPPRKGRRAESAQDALFKRQVGTRLKGYREYWRYTQKEMARFLEISPSTLNNYEIGESFPPPAILSNLILWGISMDYLLAGTGKMFVRDGLPRPDHMMH